MRSPRYNQRLFFLGKTPTGKLLGISLFCFSSENVFCLVAGAVGSTEAFVLAFGLMVTLKWLNNISTAPLSGWLWDRDLLLGNPSYFFAVLATPMIIGTLLLLPMKAQLFNVAPPLRQAASLAPKYRNTFSLRPMGVIAG